MTETSAHPPEPEFRSGLYEGTAADYDRYRLPYADDLIKWVKAELALDGTGVLVDLGAGTGHVARALRPFFQRAVAVDAEPDMVAYGRARTERESDGIEWQLARAEQADFQSESVDVIAAGNAFHRFDRRAVVANANRWLVPAGAILLLWSDGAWPGAGRELWQRELSPVINEWLERSGAAARIPAGWERKECPDELLLREAGFGRQVVREVTTRHVWTIDTILGFLHATSFASLAALQQHANAFDADVRKALLAVDQNGVYEQDVSFGARIARR
jgi:SAM-dependent methyltransferase